MKTFLILFLFTSLCCVQCKKATFTGEKLTGKLIINGACDHYVIQLQKGKIDTANIESSWLDQSNDKTYTNVFTVANACSFGNYGLQQGDVFTFQIASNLPSETCSVCQIFVATPRKQNTIINVQKVQ
ncbi:MAG: hypothetical protein ABI374_08150 [Ginsengibacter sp.]